MRAGAERVVGAFFVMKRWLSIVLLVTLVVAQKLSAQSPEERRVIDSILAALPGASIPSVTNDKNLGNCARLSPSIEHLCKGLLWTASGGFLPMGDHQSIGSGLQLGSVSRDTITYCSGGMRSGDAAAAGRNEFWEASLKTPSWGVTYYGMALIELDSKHRYDSVFTLLQRARTAGGMPTGLIDLLEARTRYFKGDKNNGWRLMISALRDTSSATHSAIGSIFLPLLPTSLRRTWDSLPPAARAEWMIRQNQIRDLVAHSVVPVLMKACVSSRMKIYAEEKRGSGMLVIPYEIEGPTLKLDTLSKKPMRQVYRYQLLVHAVRESDGLVVELDSNRTTELPIPIQMTGPLRSSFECIPSTSSPSGQVCGYAEGASMPDRSYRLLDGVELSVPPGTYVVTISMLQDQARRGITKVFSSVTIDPPSPNLSTTDLVLGIPDQGITWNSGSQMVRLNPGGEWNLDGTASLYARVRGLNAGAPFHVTLQLFKFDGNIGVNQTPVVKLEMDERASASTLEWAKILDLHRLPVAQYCVTVDFLQSERRVRAVDRIVINLHVGEEVPAEERRRVKSLAEKPGLTVACAALAGQ